MVQLVQPNLTVTGQVGWCLAYARQVFGVPALYPTAWQAWLNTKYKHTDRNFPNVAVPVWFSYQTAGHVVVYVPNKGFYSSPYKTGQAYYVGSSIADIELKYSCRFVGWSEDINNVRVAQEANMIPDADNYYWRYNKLMLQVRGRTMTRDEFRKSIVGVSDLTAIERISDDVESDRATDAQMWAIANRASVEKRIVDLQASVASLDKRLAEQSAQLLALSQTINEKNAEISGLQDQVVQLTEENKELKAQLATSGNGDDTELLNSIGQLLRKFIERIGLK
jgi:uncharacterized coiled-coil protein SlyX